MLSFLPVEEWHADLAFFSGIAISDSKQDVDLFNFVVNGSGPAATSG
jgi:hypothetical protein